MPEPFDFTSFHRALSSTVSARGVNWKTVSQETGVSQSTLSRMSAGRQPDAAALTALAAWSGLNPVNFYKGAARHAEPMAMVTTLLRSDPLLDDEGAEALEAIIKAAYDRFKKRTP